MEPLRKPKNAQENTFKNWVYLLVAVMGAALAFMSYEFFDGIWQSIVINIASNLITTGVFSFFIIDKLLLTQERKSRERNRQEINVLLSEEGTGKLYKLPLELRRGEISRSEISGRIGSIAPGNKFTLSHLGTRNFLQDLNTVLENDDCYELIILCTKEEVHQFQDRYLIPYNSISTSVDRPLDSTSQQ
jgi:hypothetical protein